jgi:hypothetical protein
MQFLMYYTDLSVKLKKINMKENNRLNYNRDEYLPLIKKFFEQKMKNILSTDEIQQSYLDGLVNIYMRIKNTREIFLTIYEFFENCVEKLGGFSGNYNKYDFIYDFLQFGVSKDIEKISSNRAELIIGFIRRKNYICNIIKNLLIPELTKLSFNLVEGSNEGKKIIDLKKEMEKIIYSQSEILNMDNGRNLLFKKTLKKFDSSQSKQKDSERGGININQDLDEEIEKQGLSIYSDEQMCLKLLKMFKCFFASKIFGDFDEAANLKKEESKELFKENDKYEIPADADETDINVYKGNSIIHSYWINFENESFFNFNEITNPSMQSLFLYDVLGLQIIKYIDKKEEKKLKNSAMKSSTK